MAIPIIRATVTVAEATPNAAWPRASTAAVERGVTVSPMPSPKAPMSQATSGTPATPEAKPGSECPAGGCRAQGAEGDPLDVGSAVQDAVDEDGPAHDRR